MTAEPAGARGEATERPLVVFSLDDQRYAVALARVQRALRVVAITPLPKAPAIVLGIVDLGGVVIPSSIFANALATRRALFVCPITSSLPRPGSEPSRCWSMRRTA